MTSKEHQLQGFKYLKALPKITWALWRDDQHKAVKNHVHFEVLKGVPAQGAPGHDHRGPWQ